MLLKACINGRRGAEDHPALPITPSGLAEAARRSVEAGAGAIHLHPRNSDGEETLEAPAVGAATAAVRGACGPVPVGVSTGAWIEADPARRAALVRGWGELPADQRPDFASSNLFEEGWREVFEALSEAGIGLEAGLWSPDDARRLLEAGLADRCLRILLEPVRETVADEALASSGEMDRLLDEAGVGTPRLLHGKDATAWPVLRHAAERDYELRIGLEDTLTLPGAEPAPDNAGLVAAARQIADAADPASPR